MSKECLVVDDSSVVRKVSRRIMENLGFSVREAEDGKQALEACIISKPTCILLDWNMPVMDGFSFLKEYKSSPSNQDVPVIFCTTENDIAKIQQAIMAGASEYVMKPFDAEVLKGKLMQLGLI